MGTKPEGKRTCPWWRSRCSGRPEASPVRAPISARGQSGLRLRTDWWAGEVESELEQQSSDSWETIRTQIRFHQFDHSNQPESRRAKQASHVNPHTSLSGFSPVRAKGNHSSVHRSVTMTTESFLLPGRLFYPVTYLKKTAVYVTMIGKFMNFHDRLNGAIIFHHHIGLRTPTQHRKQRTTNQRS